MGRVGAEADTRSGACSPQTDGRTPSPKSTSTQLIECKEVELVTVWSLHPYGLVSLVREVLGRLLKEKLGHKLSHKTMDLKSLLSARCVGAMVVQNLWA